MFGKYVTDKIEELSEMDSDDLYQRSMLEAYKWTLEDIETDDMNGYLDYWIETSRENLENDYFRKGLDTLRWEQGRLDAYRELKEKYEELKIF